MSKCHIVGKSHVTAHLFSCNDILASSLNGNFSLKHFYTPLLVLLDFSLTVKAVPHEYAIRTGQP